MKTTFLIFAALAVLLPACASPQPVNDSAPMANVPVPQVVTDGLVEIHFSDNVRGRLICFDPHEGDRRVYNVTVFQTMHAPQVKHYAAKGFDYRVEYDPLFYQDFPMDSLLRAWFDNQTIVFARCELAFDEIGTSTTWIQGRQQNKTLHFYDSYGGGVPQGSGRSAVRHWRLQYSRSKNVAADSRMGIGVRISSTRR